VRLARFWTRAQAEATSPNGKKIRAGARGWSDDSLDAARNKALEIAQRVAERIASSSFSKQRYPYGDRPLPEPVIREFRSAGGDATAIVTRNVYGALVLNAEKLMFVDVDNPDGQTTTGSSLGSIFTGLFGKPKADPQTATRVMETLGSVVQRHGLSARVYETAAGFRIIITSAPFTAGSSAAESLLAEFGSDPLYIRLCRLQECFRARLTPKPWRCGMGNPPASFPIETPVAQQRFDRWQESYAAKTAAFATCRFVAAVGPASVIPEFDELIRYHDESTRASTDLRLA
jgi:hypothetical protein